MKFEPVFYENRKDDNHCLQASIMMLLNTLGRRVSWEQVNEFTEYDARYYSWTPRAVIELNRFIPGVMLWSSLDYKQFAERGEEYFLKHNENNLSWFETQKKHASPNFGKEQNASRKLVRENLVIKKQTHLEDIEKLLRDNLIISVVDAGKLAQQPRSVGHFVLIFSQTRTSFIIHDPGLPPRRSWSVAKNDFMHSFENELIAAPKGRLNFGIEVNRNDACPCGAKKANGTPIKYKHCHGK